MAHRSFFALALVAGCVGEPACPPAPEPPGRPPDVRVLSWNVGNADASDPRYLLRMSDQRYEDHVGARIRALRPDVVALQEVLPPTACAAFEETDRARACYAASERPPAVRRLLGDDYSIVCDARRHVECVGVRVGFGTIRGVVPGDLVLDGAETDDLPLPPCEYDACEGDGLACDAESAVATVLVDTAWGAFRVVHAHPTAIGTVCRQLQTAQAFSLADVHPTILLGDWNFDPERSTDVLEASIWSRHVGPARRFTDHGARDGTCRALRTSVGRKVAIDRVVSDFLSGVCVPLRSPRLDDGFDFAASPVARIDHYAVACDFWRVAP
jgi:endonuclease/exonuclease/phosphatase family metal-dependent hydrolase